MTTANFSWGIILLTPVFLLSACSGKKGAEPENMNGKTVTVTGTAQNGKEGALVLTDSGPYYLDGMDVWTEVAPGKPVEVTGILHHETGDEENLVNEKGEYRAGATGRRMVLREAQWKIKE